MKPWHGVALAVAVLAVLGGLVYRWGVTAERLKANAERAELIRVHGDSMAAHAARTAAIRAENVARETSERLAVARAIAAESKAQRATHDVAETREALKATQTAFDASRSGLDSLKTYPPLVGALRGQVAALERKVVASDSARDGHKEVARLAQQRAAGLQERIAEDSAALHASRVTIARLISVTRTEKRSGWGCTAGASIASGIRSGAGIGITCGRRLG